jgi:hypothetical protein
MSDQDPILSGLIEQYVLGLCTPEEKAELDQQRLQDPVLHQAILDAEAKMEALFLDNAVQPSTLTDEKILASLDALQPTPALVTPLRTATKRWKRVAAVTIGLLMLSGWGFPHSHKAFPWLILR